MKTSDDVFIIAFDLYTLRYVVKNKWYLTHDILRDHLRGLGYSVEYKKDTLIFDGIDMRAYLKKVLGKDENGGEK